MASVMTDLPTQALYERYEVLKGAEEHKNSLIEELLHRLDKSNKDYEQERLDHARESEFNRGVQLREMQLQNELRHMKSIVDRDAFVLVLIDGDGMIFEDHLIQKGEDGGREAASMLWAAVRDYVHKHIPGLSSDYKIMTRIYANLKGLGDVCHKTGILEKPSLIEDFARGFTGSKQLFDFVDVGSGKDRADDKISEIFKLHLYDCHCRHILFGCSHDNGYARVLEDVVDQRILGSITLLEGVPFERELLYLKNKYAATRFENIFRTTKINLYHQQHQYFQAPQPVAKVATVPYQSPYQPGINRNQSSSTSSSSMNPTAATWGGTGAANTWATAALAPVLVASPPPTPQPAPAAGEGISRNRFGQRVDQLPAYDKQEVYRVKGLHLCNVHYLRGDCPYGDGCSHEHHYKVNKNEMKTLKYVGRMTPCKFGTECEDTKCIYGHRCPLSQEGRSDCFFGDDCRFDDSMHGIDTKIVKTVKVGGK